ncbi:hypothetical protein CYLTODRAFT_421351 [Cylindrobasidium torrendii FP15055 ss-10]|uniref:Uncharacterized protein n=1 Tax=Cylindrobasidium torrendii FP15055 ss-10 TaxID=1314674 RepID=A0A0D7BGD0_9AGAR|nr:hypothetical protein CYLTODRAFT_421351 [Cylindrobasidium torrendii FP15055 ss-10]
MDEVKDDQDYTEQAKLGLTLGILPSNAPMPSTLLELKPNLKLHSPSQIIGTPFAVDLPRFEYPFPAESSRSPPADILSNAPSMTSSPASPLSSAGSLSSLCGVPTLQSVSVLASTYASPPPELQGLSPARVKKRLDTIPVPPSVRHKRKRPIQRKSSGGEDSDSAILPDVSPDATNTSRGV